MDSNLGSIRSADKRVALATAVILALGVAASINANAAAPVIYGGGATLPAAAYEGGAKADSTSRLATSVKAPTGALFQVFLNLNPTLASVISYCQTGSGTGRKVLEQVLQANGTCGDFTGTPTGFSAPTAFPDFAASDAPLAQSDVDAVVALAGKKQPVQVPTVAASIAVAYHGVTGLSGNPNLTDAQLCSIFNGTFTNWSQVFPGASGTINVIYRSDGSGTSFSFSNHLSKVCTAAGGRFFTTDQTFTNVIAHAGPGGAAATYAASTPASGNPGMVTALAASTGGIAYVETEDALNRNGGALSYFKIQPKGGAAFYDPIADFAPSGQLSIATAKNKVVSGVNSVGQPVLTTATGTPKPNCLIIAIPNAYANYTTEYPIVGVSNLLTYVSGNPHKASVSALMQLSVTQPASTTIGAGKGYAYLKDANGNITAARLKACVLN